MLDSPFVRRVAISFDLQDIPFEHRALSVFRNFDEFSRINPTVKAPTLVLDDGSFLIDSTLILEYGDALAGSSLLPAAPAARARALRAIGPALAACEKTAQIVYEYSLRPQEKQHQPWLDRVQQQLFAALRLLEAETDAFDIDALAGRSLLPAAPAARAQALRAIGPALAACEKTAQIVYEYSLRPQEKQHQPWLDRVQQQLFAAHRQLEAESASFDTAALDQAAVTAAVTWSFVRLMVPQIVAPDAFPRLAAWTARAEALPVFQRYPLI
jgi:glutathione S-transferase